MFRQCVSGKGEWYHLEHFTPDVSFRDPMFSSEGRQDLSAVFTLARSVSEESGEWSEAEIFNDVNETHYVFRKR